ncbi:fumarate reductase flavoprotein subunit [Nitzschia inconspicua]|uniref:Fumarate reductase flavoprotein subunit n=1 Tax=Nitzschia inconspicua TaxID=303405 RepID=A0A9K3L7L9_9STRA|nr:fumarate reductase flavoprotein subunit [Nitzschia inconspicua]
MTFLATCGESTTDAVVIGSGFAGLTASLEILDRGGRVIIVEKESSMGGNSIKASSGINGCSAIDGEMSQDEVESFIMDTTKSAGDRANPTLIRTLVSNSAESLQWLQERLGVDLQSKTKLGGHCSARTHRPAKGTIGYSLISALKTELQKFQESGMLQIMTSTTATKLIQDETVSPNSVTGIKVTHRDDNDQEEEIVLPSKNVILATGGFAAARDEASLLAQYAPHLLDMPATFGSFSTGDGVQLASVAGAGRIDMEQIQIHPTGFVDPKDPQNPSKILCAEVMRGVGGILLSQGKRFCDELGTREYIVSRMMERNKETNDAPFYILLSSAAAKKTDAHIGFYSWKGLLQQMSGIESVENFMKVDPGVIRKTILQYRSDAINGKDDFGKSSFPDNFSDDLDQADFYVGCVTPVLHYCMGGLTIDASGRVLNEEHNAIPGLWAAGEVAGGVHGCNRLAGNSLLECLVYGRIIGKQITL